MPTPRAIAIGSTGSVMTPCSRMTRLAASDAVQARSGWFISLFLFRLALCEGLQDVVGDVAVSSTELVQMAMQPVGARRLLHLVDAAEQEVCGDFQRIGEPAEIVKGRLPRARLEMRDGRGLQVGAVGCRNPRSRCSDVLVNDTPRRSRRKMRASPDTDGVGPGRVASGGVRDSARCGRCPL